MTKQRTWVTTWTGRQATDNMILDDPLQNKISEVTHKNILIVKNSKNEEFC